MWHWGQYFFSRNGRTAAGIVASALGLVLVNVVFWLGSADAGSIGDSLTAHRSEVELTGMDDSADEAEPGAGRFIVRAVNADKAAQLVAGVGGELLDRFEIIDAVAAELTNTQVESLKDRVGLAGLYPDAELKVLGGGDATHFPTQVGAADLHASGITGEGVTIAILDTGLWRTNGITRTAREREKIVATYDATVSFFNRRRPSMPDDDDDDYDDDYDYDDDDERDCDDECGIDDLDDWNGHGTHITSIMASSAKAVDGTFKGVAPDARVIAVRAFEPDGSGSYLNVIRGLNWIVMNRDRYGIDVLNLSFGAPTQAHYWNDPVNLAVMEAWKRGITVVASAGNGGPAPMTIGVPANVPYIITVGAFTDSYSPYDESDDRLARFSATGPTVEGFVKPDVIAPGGHMLGAMPPYAWLPLEYPEYVRKVGSSFEMSGTSQAAAVVSGIVALMIEDDPGLTPDDIKCRLISTARPAVLANGDAAYSVFQQGSGRASAVGAVSSRASGCANRGLRLSSNIFRVKHYAGPAGVDPDGTYYLVDDSGTRMTGPAYEWVQGSLWPEGISWSPQELWSSGTLWGESVRFRDAGALNPGSLVSQGALWPEGSLWSVGMKTPVSTYLWVDQE
ncbi:MAG: S8 family peptidase [Pseudomonadota bacterium]